MLHGITINLHLFFSSNLHPWSKLFKTLLYFFLLVLFEDLFDKFLVCTPIDSGRPGLVSDIENKVVPAVGHTTFRPPYTPVSIGAIVGREVGKHSKPTRKSPMHTWHEKNNAVFVDAGVWLRPRYYKQGNETLFEGSKREAKNVRTNVGVCDVTTLGKIDIKGPDAAELLNRVYTNAWLKLPVGKARYGVMLREDGIVMDDGTTTRISENHYHMTTTTG